MSFSRLKPLLFLFILILASACNGGTAPGGSTAVVGSSLVAHCGNSTCETSLGETAASCPADCSTSPGTGSATPPGGTGPGGTGPGATPPGTPPPGAGASGTCGNGICESGETHTSCSADCGDPSVAGFEIISLNPSVIIMNAGTTSSPIRIDVRRLGGDTSILNLGISNVSPLVAGLSNSPTTIGASNTADFTISADVSVPSDEYRLTLKVDSSVGVRYVTLIVKVLPASTPGGGGTPPGGGASCGDGTCTPPETAVTCPRDCGFDPSRPPVCGDGFCHPAETSSGCPADCPTSASCDNDGLCEVGETPATCDHDCAPGGPVCGDGTCTPPEETTAVCPADCRPAPGGGMPPGGGGTPPATFTRFELVSASSSSSTAVAGGQITTEFTIRRNDELGSIQIHFEQAEPRPRTGTITAAPRTIPAGTTPTANGEMRTVVSPDVPPGMYTISFSLSSDRTERRAVVPLMVQPTSCGDRICGPSEALTCPEDCVTPTCNNDGHCDVTETHATCPLDCPDPGTPPPPGGGTPPMGFIPPDLPGLDLPSRACTDEARSVWVTAWERGNDTNPGTVAAPVSNLLVALDMALRSTPPKDVCVTDGRYMLQRGGYSNYTLTPNTRADTPVNFYGGYRFNVSTGRMERPSDMNNPENHTSIITNNGSVPVVTYQSAPASSHPVFEGFKILQDGNSASNGVPAVAIRGSAPIFRKNTIEITNTPRSDRLTPDSTHNFKRVGLEVTAVTASSYAGLRLESNLIKVGDVLPRFGSAMGIHIVNQSPGGGLLTIKNNKIEVGRASKVSAGILGWSTREDTSSENRSNYLIEHNEILFGAATQRIVIDSEPAPSDDWDPASGGSMGTSDDGPYGYAERQGGQSGGIILGMNLSTRTDVPVLAKQRFGIAKVLRNKMRSRISLFSSGYASYGIVMEGGTGENVIGSNFIQSGQAKNISAGLLLEAADIRVFNNTISSAGVELTQPLEVIPGGGGVLDGYRFQAISTPVLLGSPIPTVRFVNNIFTALGSNDNVLSGIFSSNPAPEAYNGVIQLQNNLFDALFPKIISQFVNDSPTLRNVRDRSNYNNALTPRTTTSRNFVVDSILVNPRSFDFSLQEGSPAIDNGLCTGLSPWNPKDIDGTDWPATNCDMGAKER